jgi:hypothetical protein
MTRKQSVSIVIGAVVWVAWIGGCRPLPEEADEYRNGIPRQETVEMKVPAQAGQPLTAETHQQALRGQVSDFYKLTRAVSGVVNGGGAFVLVLVKAVVSHRPTSVTADSATWGPWTGALEPVTWMVTVTRIAEHKYRYEFAGRDRKLDDGPFTVVLSGTHAPSVDGDGHAIEGFGSGEFTLDWDARAKLPVPGREVGSAHYTYARTSPTATVEIDAQFRQVNDDNNPGRRIDVDYIYRSTPAAGGSMQFVSTMPPQMSMNGGRWAVKSRWTQEGAGRSDVRATGGDLPQGFQATASECWDTGFASAFFQANWPLAPSYGDEATNCVFKPAEYSNL